jgi:hypothetical protein
VDEIPILERIRLYFANWGLNGSISDKMPEFKSAELRVYSSELALWFSALFGRVCEEKSIPHDWMETWQIDDLAKIKDAYVEGDGYKRNKQIEWVSCSGILSMQMAKISEMEGYNVSMKAQEKIKRVAVNKRHKFSEGELYWIGGYTTDHSNSDWSGLYARMNNYTCLPVVSVETKIESKKDVRVYDLTVEDDESFVVGMASVHNCCRIGQKSVVQVINFICKDTIEERIRGVISAKNKISNEVLGDNLDEAVIMRMNPKEIAKLL